MAAGVIRARISRFDPDRDSAPYFQQYEVPVDRKVTVHELLTIIHRELDGTLAFRPYKCYKGMCLTCTVRVNGQNVRSCATPVEPDGELVIEPPLGGQVVRDLVVDFERM